jgi:hypothetical protein
MTLQDIVNSFETEVRRFSKNNESYYFEKYARNIESGSYENLNIDDFYNEIKLNKLDKDIFCLQIVSLFNHPDCQKLHEIYKKVGYDRTVYWKLILLKILFKMRYLPIKDEALKFLKEELTDKSQNFFYNVIQFSSIDAEVSAAIIVDYVIEKYSNANFKIESDLCVCEILSKVYEDRSAKLYTLITTFLNQKNPSFAKKFLLEMLKCLQLYKVIWSTEKIVFIEQEISKVRSEN